MYLSHQRRTIPFFEIFTATIVLYYEKLSLQSILSKPLYTYIFEIGKKTKKPYFRVMFAHSSSDFIVSLSIIFVTIINVAEFSTALRKISVERWFDNQ